ncbi:MAG TPA: GPW/gp25 family protein [Bacteroidales bacterium]
MVHDFLQMPLQVDLVTRQKPLKRCSLYESVAGMIHLVLTTRFGEIKCDESFGNELWEHDFENIDNVQAFKDRLSESLRRAISVHEKRLTDVKINIGFEQVLTTLYNRRVRQRIEINLEGVLSKTNEEFTYHDVFFTGPLSYF